MPIKKSKSIKNKKTLSKRVNKKSHKKRGYKKMKGGRPGDDIINITILHHLSGFTYHGDVDIVNTTVQSLKETYLAFYNNTAAMADMGQLRIDDFYFSIPHVRRRLVDTERTLLEYGINANNNILQFNRNRN